MTGSMTFAFGGNDDNVTRDYYVQLYKTQDYVFDFRTVFVLETDRRDYKKLRDYLNIKEEIMRILKMAGDEYYYGLSYSQLYTTDYIQGLEDEINSRDPDEKILLRLNSVRPSFNYSGEFAVEHIETVILPVIRQRFMEATTRDSINQAAYMQIQKNIGAIQKDIFLAEQAIYASLSPEFRDQDFRVWISLTFSGLIAVILFSFFLVIYRRSDSSLCKLLLSSSGLQFITVFVLIIAIILFGILKVLGGSELATILSGISGYILGKGGAEVIGKISKEKEPPAPAEAPIIREEPESIVEMEPSPEEKPQTKTETEAEIETEEEKFFPGGC
jgi:hypothetical protein